MPNVQIAGLCDVDESHVGEKLKYLEGKGCKKPATYTDFRKMLEDKNIDADVDCHAESLARAADDLGRARQARTSTSRSRARTTSSSRSKSSPRPASTTAWSSRAARADHHPRCTRRSACGAARSARSTWRAGSATSGATPSARPPIARAPGVDYDLWLGPAPKRPFNRRTASITTGTGSGTPATATSATRASTKSTSRDGASASRIRRRSPRSAASSCSTTTRRRRTRSARPTSSTSTARRR